MDPRNPPRPTRSFQLWRFSDDAANVALAVSGEIDISNASAFRHQLNALADGIASDVTLDLSACSFIDSTAVNALVLAGKDQLQQGRRLGLAGLPLRARRVLELAGLFNADTFITHPEPPPDDE